MTVFVDAAKGSIRPDHPIYSLSKLLNYAGYPESSQTRLLSWFQEHVEPAIAPALTNSVPWRPNLTWNFSPFEPSLNISSNEKKTVRFGIEPVGFHAGTIGDVFNQRAVQELLHSFRKEMPQLDLTLFRHFYRDFEVPITAESIKKLALQKSPLSSSHFCAFDFAGDDVGSIDTKVYFILDQLALLTGSDVMDLIQCSVLKLDQVSGTDFYSAVGEVTNFLASNPFVSGKDVEMLAVDCKALSRNSRIKIYAHSYTCTFECVEQVLTMGGLLSKNEDTIAHLALIEELWHTLLHDAVPERTYPGWKVHALSPVRNLNDRPQEFIFSFEVRSGCATPEIKFYFPIRFYNASDMVTAERVSDFLAARGWTDTAKEYKQMLRKTLPLNDLDSKGGTHTYLAVAYSKKKGPYVTMYWQPKLN